MPTGRAHIAACRFRNYSRSIPYGRVLSKHQIQAYVLFLARAAAMDRPADDMYDLDDWWDDVYDW